MQKALVKDLTALLGRGAVASDEADLLRYGGDALGVYRAFHSAPRLNERASAVVSPESADGISKTLEYATRNSLPVVPYGRGTGVMGAATAIDSGIVLNTQRMNRILKVDADSRTGAFQSGTVLENAHRALAANRLRLGHDPWSRPIATIGGAISTNGVGYTASGHGAMGDQVLGLRVVLGDGEIVETRAVPEALFGSSLNHVFIGTEGSLGVIAEATVQAFRVPVTWEMLCFDFPEFDSGFEAINEVYGQGLRPTVMDYGDELASDGSGGRETATLYLAFEGSEKRVDAYVSDTTAICSRHDGRRGSEAHVRRYWTNRHASALRYKRNVLESEAPDDARKSRSAYRMDYLHVALPVGKVLEYRRKCERLLSNEGVEVREWSVWGRPEFFSFLISGSENGDDGANLGRTVDRVLTLAQSMGGSMEYCHGVGLKLAHMMEAELGTGMSAAHRIKKALDPAGILNPGKAWG